MDKSRSTARERLRIIWAIAAKDITDAIKNKTILSVVLGMAMLMLSSQALPFLLKLSASPRVIVYDAGKTPHGTSRLLSVMAEDGYYHLTEVESQQAMEDTLADLNAEVLGLVIPAGTEAHLDAGAGAEMEGYVIWSRRSAASELAAEMATYLAALLQEPVQVEVEGNLVYPPPEGTASLGMIAAVLTLVLVTTGGFLVPYLIFEEKQTHTMDALLVSPARAPDVVIGKALAGMVYCLVAMAVVLAFNHATVAGWGVAILAVLVGAILAVGVGLLMGTLFETAQQVGAWIILPILALMAPILLVSLGHLPLLLAACLPWLPTIALGDLFLLSFSGSATLGRALPDLALVLAWSVPLYAAVIWIVRRSDR
ncbi:MAG: ABC transporter permease [Anaerolineae bacterium]|jgi:ABC-2 type transport system permease protein